MSAVAGTGLGSEPGAVDAFWLSHMGGRSPAACAIVGVSESALAERGSGGGAEY